MVDTPMARMATSPFLSSHGDISDSPGCYVMPVCRSSKQAFEFIGFDPEEASRRWYVEQLLLSNPETSPETRLDTLLSALPDRIGLDSQEYFGYYKISKELRDAIMDPAFADVRGTASCGYWVRDSVCSRVRALDEYFASRGCQSLYYPLAPARTSITNDKSDTYSNVVLYKGVSSWRTAKLHDALKASKTSLDYLLEHEPTLSDFSRLNDGLYFTPQRDLALKCAAYANRRTYNIPNSSRLLTLGVPYSFLDELHHGPDLYIDHERDAWRKTVKLCRFNFFSRLVGEPPNLAGMLDNAECLVGHVSTNHVGAPVRSERGSESFRALGEGDLLYVPSLADGEGEEGRERERAVQWMFKKNVLRHLEDAVGVRGEGRLAVEAPGVAEMQEKGFLG